KGLMSEAGKVVIEWLKSQASVQRIWAASDLDNMSSIKLLEKLDFKREGILKKWLIFPAFGSIARDCYIYAHTWS
ncbi:MAG: GNAT family protein, partial [Gammaproteobacteria bacterium]|nr:GNAT family protein [Gammaproteobacteria bacterium]